MDEETTGTPRKKPGRRAVPGTDRYNVVLEKVAADWALDTPEGLSAMLRRLLAAEKARQEKVAAKGGDR